MVEGKGRLALWMTTATVGLTKANQTTMSEEKKHNKY